MFIERSPVQVPAVSRGGEAAPPVRPVPYRVVIRIDDRQDAEAVSYMVGKVFGEGVEVSERNGGRISGRVWLEIAGFPREIAEAKAEALRRGALLGRIGIGVQIKKAD